MRALIQPVPILLTALLCLALMLIPGPMAAAPGPDRTVATVAGHGCAGCPLPQDGTMRCGAERAVLPEAAAPGGPPAGGGSRIVAADPAARGPQHGDPPPTRPA